jgi:hypothetical protein
MFDLSEVRLSPSTPSLNLWNIVENSGLNRWQWRGLAGRTWEDKRTPALVPALDEPDRELRSECAHSPAPSLTGRGVPKTEGLKIIPGIVEKSLCALIVEIEVSRAGQIEQRRNPSVE